jgi:hypothetical protein
MHGDFLLSLINTMRPNKDGFLFEVKGVQTAHGNQARIWSPNSGEHQKKWVLEEVSVEIGWNFMPSAFAGQTWKIL